MELALTGWRKQEILTLTWVLDAEAGGNVWESNPPTRVLAGLRGFEDRRRHQSPSAPSLAVGRSPAALPRLDTTGRRIGHAPGAAKGRTLHSRRATPRSARRTRQPNGVVARPCGPFRDCAA